MGGISSLALAASLFIFDLRKIKYRFKFAEAFGVNSILAYSLSSILTVIFYSSELWGIAFNQEFIKFWGNIWTPIKIGFFDICNNVCSCPLDPL